MFIKWFFVAIAIFFIFVSGINVGGFSNEHTEESQKKALAIFLSMIIAVTMMVISLLNLGIIGGYR